MIYELQHDWVVNVTVEKLHLLPGFLSGLEIRPSVYVSGIYDARTGMAAFIAAEFSNGYHFQLFL